MSRVDLGMRKTLQSGDGAILTSGKLLANLTLEVIGETFGIPSHHSMTHRTRNGATIVYDAGLDRCVEVINKNWMQKPRPHISKVPKTLTIF